MNWIIYDSNIIYISVNIFKGEEMNNNRLATLLTEVVKEVIEDKSEIIIDDELKEDIWDAIYAELNKEIY